LYKYIRFNTSVESATWDDSKNRWKVDVTVTGAKDAEFNPAYSINCDFLVSAVGQLNQPRYPDIEGLNDFKGKIMHSARWDWSYSLEDKNVGIIGNGTYHIRQIENRLTNLVNRSNSCTNHSRDLAFYIIAYHLPTLPELGYTAA
jgi:hypothetical protein